MDAEMWPEEQFGGISDEQFWDDLASDKPLETTARTAGSEAGPAQPPRRQRPGEQRPGEQRPGEQRPGEQRPGEQRPGEQRPGEQRPGEQQRPGEFRPSARPAALVGQAGTQAFAATGPATGPQSIHQTGPQPVQASTQAFPASPSQSAQGTTQAFQLSAIQAAQATGPQPIRAVTQPQPTQPSTQPAADRSAPRRPQYQPPQPAPARAGGRPPVSQQAPRLPASQPSPLPALPATPQSGTSSTAGMSRGRHSSGEDPLTSAAYSLRSSGSVDGRSYQASRRAREMSRDQYETAISQETQTFSMTDSEPAYPGTPPYGYDMPSGQGSYVQGGSPRPGRRDDHGTGGYPYPYGQPNQAAPLAHTSPYGAEDGWGSGARDGWGSGARDHGRPQGKGGRADPGQYDAGRAYQNGYPAPYDPRGTDRR